MKILRVLLILLVPALGIVGCRKSDIKPGCSENTSVPATQEGTPEISGRMINGVEIEEEEEGTTIVGQGDDDRDGHGDVP